MDTSSVQNRTYHKSQGHRSSRNTSANVNPGQQQGPSTSGRQPPSNAGNGTNPPAGMQKKLQQQARNQRTPKADRSQDRCLKCNNLGHWARDCTVNAVNATNGTTVTTIVPEKQTWSDINIVSTISNSGKHNYDYTRAEKLWPKLSTNCVSPN